MKNMSMQEYEARLRRKNACVGNKGNKNASTTNGQRWPKKFQRRQFSIRFEVYTARASSLQANSNSAVDCVGYFGFCIRWCFLHTKANYNWYRPSKKGSLQDMGSFNYENFTATPTSMDWRTKSIVMPVKNSGQCGGVFTGECGKCGLALDHNMTAMGYGTTSDRTKY